MTLKRAIGAAFIVCSLAVLAYLPAQTLPFIADDYLQIQLGRDYGPIEGWSSLLADPLYRCRATSIVLTHWTEHYFQLDPIPYNISSLILHAVNALLILALGNWRAIGWPRAFFAASFFAVAEGHQEAVMWYSAVPELLVFLFVAGSALAFLGFLRGGPWRWVFYGLAFLSFLFALASKESGVVAVGALVLIGLVERVATRRIVLQTTPFALAACIYVASIFISSKDILHFHDGTFELNAPFALTIAMSAARMLWIWGFAALALLAVLDRGSFRGFVPAVLAWIAIALFPYAFITYMDRVPSRHTYLASVGLSLLAGAAFGHLASLRGKQWAAVAALALIGQNCVYLWTKKLHQYELRADPTERLIRTYSTQPTDVRIECFPYSRWVAKFAVEVGARKRWEDSHWRPRAGCKADETVIVVPSAAHSDRG